MVKPSRRGGPRSSGLQVMLTPQALAATHAIPSCSSWLARSSEVTARSELPAASGRTCNKNGGLCRPPRTETPVPVLTVLEFSSHRMIRSCNCWGPYIVHRSQGLHCQGPTHQPHPRATVHTCSRTHTLSPVFLPLYICFLCL